MKGTKKISKIELYSAYFMMGMIIILFIHFTLKVFGIC